MERRLFLRQTLLVPTFAGLATHLLRTARAETNAGDAGFWFKVEKPDGTSYWNGPYTAKNMADAALSAILVNPSTPPRTTATSPQYYPSHPANQWSPQPEKSWF